MEIQEEKKNKKLYIIIAILTILLIDSVGYIVYNEFIKKDETIENNENTNTDKNNQDNESNNEKENNKLSEEELNKLGLELFSRTSIELTSNITSGNYMFYKEYDITYNDLKNEERLEYTYMQIPKNLKTYNSEDAYRDSCINTDNYQYTCYYEKVSTKTFEEYYHKMFGSNKNINYENFEVIIDKLIFCKQESEEIVCYPSDGGGIKDHTSYLEYDYANQDEDRILLYVKFLVLGYNGTESGVFSDAAMNNKIADESPEVTSNNIFDIYGDEAGLYKVTFKKDTNDNYYWYSSEIIK